MCLVTIGLPVYNMASFLADAIRSVLNQTLTDWELIVIDDGSTDQSLAVARSFTDPRIRVLADGVNRGVATRLNQLAALARGIYLARMDADDVMMANRLQTQVEYMRLNPGTDVVGAWAYVIDTQNQVCGLRSVTRLPQTRSEVVRQVPFINPTILARTNWFRANPYRADCRRAEDFDLWLRTVETSSFYVIAQPLLFYRERGLRSLEKYGETAAAVRGILRRFHRHSLSRGQWIQAILVSYAKAFTYQFFGRIGRVNGLLNRRNRLLTSEEWATAQGALLRAITIVTTSNE